MIIGLTLSQFTTLHVVISLLAILIGIVVISEMTRGVLPPALTAAFLAATVLTSVTGFLFQSTMTTPGQIVGGISLVALIVAGAALYLFRLRSGWRVTFIAASALALYLNVFVGVVQAFQKMPWLARLAPTQSEPPFVVAQAAVLTLALLLTWLAARRFRPMVR